MGEALHSRCRSSLAFHRGRPDGKFICRRKKPHPLSRREAGAGALGAAAPRFSFGMTFEVKLDAVKVPKYAVLGAVDEGWPELTAAIGKTIPVLCAYKVGGCQSLMDKPSSTAGSACNSARQSDSFNGFRTSSSPCSTTWKLHGGHVRSPVENRRTAATCRKCPSRQGTGEPGILGVLHAGAPGLQRHQLLGRACRQLPHTSLPLSLQFPRRACVSPPETGRTPDRMTAGTRKG